MDQLTHTLTPSPPRAPLRLMRELINAPFMKIVRVPSFPDEVPQRLSITKNNPTSDKYDHMGHTDIHRFIRYHPLVRIRSPCLRRKGDLDRLITDQRFSSLNDNEHRSGCRFRSCFFELCVSPVYPPGERELPAHRYTPGRARLRFHR